MSERLDPGSYYDNPEWDFVVGEKVSFLHNGSRLHGKVVRVYQTRDMDMYHVEVNGQRYKAEPVADEMRRE